MLAFAWTSGVHECPALAAPKEERYDRQYEQDDAVTRERSPGRLCDRHCCGCHVRRLKKRKK